VFSGTELRSICDGPPVFAASCVVGVGSSWTAARVSDWNAPLSLVTFPASSTVGVGNRRKASIARLGPWFIVRPAAGPFWITVEFHSSHQSTVLPSPMSFTAGVGRSAGGCQDGGSSSHEVNSLGSVPAAISMFCSNDGPLIESRLVAALNPVREDALRGVASNDEDALSLVGSSGVGSAYNAPRRVIPQAGKVGKDGIESEGNMPPDILQQDVAGS
jgi:hypothetical protein